jgi:hypothetical protein
LRFALSDDDQKTIAITPSGASFIARW